MTRIPVEMAVANTGELTDQIRQLAYHLFESRGGSDGRDVDDWLDAERELILTPAMELQQKDGTFEIRMPAEGYGARQIHVTALPSSLVVKAASGDTAGHKTLLATIDLPTPIEVEKTTASLENGILYVTAVRQIREHEPAAV